MTVLTLRQTRRNAWILMGSINRNDVITGLELWISTFPEQEPE